MSGPVDEHRRAAGRTPLGCALLTISDTRTRSNDRSGDLMTELVLGAGHLVVERELVPDDPPRIEQQLRRWIGDDRVQVALCTGGTGLAARDTTVEVVRSLLFREIEGFGELFRALSYERIGAAAMLSRATGGVVRGVAGGPDTLVFAMPGSPDAVELALTRLILPELGHIAWLRRPAT